MKNGARREAERGRRQEEVWRGGAQMLRSEDSLFSAFCKMTGIRETLIEVGGIEGCGRVRGLLRSRALCNGSG